MYGTVSAIDDIHLSRQLETAQLELLTCKPIRFGASIALNRYLARVSERDLIGFFVQMEQLQGAGISVLEALTNVRQATTNHSLHDILIDIHRNVTEGLSMSEAMAHHRNVFDAFCTSIITSGETTGDLLAAYRYLIRYLKWADDMKRRVRKATRYPLVVVSVVLVAVIVMMAFVVPQITEFFQFIGDGKDLPFPTVALVATSKFFQSFWWAMVVGAIGLTGIVLTGRRISSEFAYNSDRLILRLPLFGVLIRKINIARYLQTIAALYAAAIPFVDAIRTARDTINNHVLGEAAEDVISDVKAGKPFSEALTATGEFPLMVPLMIKTGEETGNMTEVLEQIGEFYNADVDEEVQKMITMIEPALTAIMGGLILWIAVGVFGPIYDLFEDLET